MLECFSVFLSNLKRDFHSLVNFVFLLTFFLTLLLTPFVCNRPELSAGHMSLTDD